MIVTTEGGALSGVGSGVDGVTVFRGIPYAADTAGENRWRAPQPPPAWSGVRVADRFGDACLQTARGGLSQPMSEDCLSLNVWTPATAADAALPVLVWIYGGRFVFGAGSEPMYDGSALASRGLVVVTVNYRLGVFGFLATRELSAESGHGASGNYGLLDQRAALQWVQRNIAAFGGDPAKVTIAGQSAGAASVLDHVYSPLSAGLFRGAIAQSGALHPGDTNLGHLAGSYRTLADAERDGEQYLSAHGVETVADARRLDAAELLRGGDADQPGPGHPRPPLFRPVQDGWMLPHTYAQTLARGAQNDVPILTGTNLDEDGATPHPQVTLAQFRERARAAYGDRAEEFLALYPAHDDETAAAASNQAARDHSRVSTHLWTQEWARHASSPVHTYFWTHPAPGPDADARGAFHGSEIPYFLHSLDHVDRPWTDADRAIADAMSGYIGRFVATGDPNGGAAEGWDAADHRPLTMELGARCGPIPVAEPARHAFHRSVLESNPEPK